MAFGCFASFLLWLAIASLWSGSLIPITLALILIAALMIRRLGPDWPLY